MSDGLEVTRRRALTAGGTIVALSVAGCLGGSAEPAEAAAFDGDTAYLDPDCGCCELHATYLADANADVDVVERSNEELDGIKDELLIPPELRSCHTTELEAGYVIEGHVPIEVINQVVEEQPDAVVVGLPGMPAGSPGMPGSKDEEWVFYTIDDDGEIGEFTRK